MKTRGFSLFICFLLSSLMLFQGVMNIFPRMESLSQNEIEKQLYSSVMQDVVKLTKASTKDNQTELIEEDILEALSFNRETHTAWISPNIPVQKFQQLTENILVIHPEKSSPPPRV